MGNRIRSATGIAVSATFFLCFLLGNSVLAQQADGFGGGGLPDDETAALPPGDEISEAERARIWAMLMPNIEMGPSIQAHPQLEWPLRPLPNLKAYGYHGISNFVDQDPAWPAQRLDYNCGTRTYDNLQGYNHAGIDFFTWPFPWNKLDDAQVAVVAVAPGRIIGKEDGYFDRSCGFNNDPWNAVYVEHDDFSIAWYGHLKNGSVTTAPIDSRVETGDYLGIVGSSGNSTGPHLHLELYDSNFLLNEPYDGPCNVMNPGDSWWKKQRPYYDSAVNHLTVGFSIPDFGSCPENEYPGDGLDYNRGDQLYFTTYYRDQRSIQTSTYTIYQPDGSVYDTWTHNPPGAYYNQSWWYWVYNNFAQQGPTGVWRFAVEYEGRTYERLFRISDPTGAGRVPGQLGDLQPLTASWDGSQVTLSWDQSCVSSDVDYGVYEGSIGSWYSHDTAVMCGTGQTTTATFAPGPGNRYYLVVPTNGLIEGSYGYTGDFAERPQGAASCHSQQIGGNCADCGNTIQEYPELCDRTDLGGEDCQSLGFGVGTLVCSHNCDAFDTSGCGTCGNGVCEPGEAENCVNCPADCNGRQQGNMSSQFCCGDGGGNNPVDCSDPRCTESGFTCE